MDTQKLISAVYDQYDLLKSVPFMGSAFKRMIWFVCTFWVLVSKLVMFILESLYGYFSRLKEEKRDDQYGMELFQTMERFLFGEADGFLEPLCEGRSVEEEGSSIGTSRYQFFGGDSFSGFIKEPKAACFTVHELFVDSPHPSWKDPEMVTTDVFAEQGFQDSDSDVKAGSRGVLFSISLADSGGDVSGAAADADHCNNMAHEEESEKHDEQPNSAPQNLNYEESDDKSAGSSELDDVVGVGNRDRDEKMMTSCSCSGDEESPEKQGFGIEADFCPINHHVPTPVVDQGSPSSNELIEDQEEERDVPDCSSRFENNLDKQETTTSVLDNLPNKEDMIDLEPHMQRIFGGQSSSSTTLVSLDTKESVGSNEAVINGSEKTETSLSRCSSSSSDQEIKRPGKASLVQNDVSDGGAIISFHDTSPSKTQSPDEDERDEKTELYIRRSSSEEKLEGRVQETFSPDDLPQMEDAIRPFFSFLRDHNFSDGSTMNSMHHEVPFDSKSTSTVDDLRCADEENGSEAREAFPVIGTDEEKSDYDGEDDPASVEAMESEANVKGSIDVKEEHVSNRQLNDGIHSSDEDDPVCEVSESVQYLEEPDELEEEEEEEDCGDHDSDDEMEEDVVWEHKERVKQMRKELRSCKTIGLPTILEELESLGLEEDLKPLKIDLKADYRGCMDEIQLFYKSYSEKMRKLDILSHQTLNAIGLVKLKNQDQLTSKRSKSLLPFKLRRHDGNPVKMLMRDMQRELELAYVGQLCFSWEILKWQYGKALDLQDYDSWGSRQYSIAAREFQQFHVLIQRFTEDEPFQGPRIQYYLRSRRIQCNLLQVPLVKDDSKNGRKGAGEGAITITMLLEIMEESMRAYWEFLHADKGEAGSTLKGIIGSNPDLQNPSDMELLTDICTDLQKKERRLKDSIRSRNCIVKKLQKHKNCRLNHDIFLAQVELRLVSRVVSMSKLTADQLRWCHKKLGKVNVVGREVMVDSSFLHFPC